MSRHFSNMFRKKQSELSSSIEMLSQMSPTNSEALAATTSRHILTEANSYDNLAFCWSKSRTWWILTIIFLIQIVMNLMASIYGNAVAGMMADFRISQKTATIGQALFLIAYAFGCELWAPWSEDFGRWKVLQMSMLLVNVCQLLCAAAPNMAMLLTFRILGGLSLAGGSVTIGMVADLREPNVHQYAVGFIVLASVGGSVVGPIIGGLLEGYFNEWRSIFWTQLALGGFAQLLHFFFVPETRSSILLTQEAQRRRSAGELGVYSESEVQETSFNFGKVAKIWIRPFHMLATEPIVLCLSLLSGFSDALIFTFIDSFTLVYDQWGFGPIGHGLAFIPLAISYIVAFVSFLPWFYVQTRKLSKDPDSMKPEARLTWLLWLAPLEPLGLLGFALTSESHYHTHWIWPMFFSLLIGIANYAIYMATIDYMIDSYGPYSASATGGNGFARDFLAGVAAFYSRPLYTDMGHPYNIRNGSLILFGLAILVILPIYVFWMFGPEIRARSKFASELQASQRRLEDNNRRRHPPAHASASEI